MFASNFEPNAKINSCQTKVVMKIERKKKVQSICDFHHVSLLAMYYIVCKAVTLALMLNSQVPPLAALLL